MSPFKCSVDLFEIEWVCAWSQILLHNVMWWRID